VRTWDSDVLPALVDFEPEDSNGDEKPSVSGLHAEQLLAIAEVVLAATAPLIYASDATIISISAAPVVALATHTGTRALASATLSSLLLRSAQDCGHLGDFVWSKTTELLELCDLMEPCVAAMATMKDLVQCDRATPTLEAQPLLPEAGQLPAVGNLDDLWVELALC